MAVTRLFDYNTSFGLLRTNPKLTGNVKITLDSSGEVWLNSMNASPTLSDQRYKKFRITGDDSYANDLFRFFSDGSLGNEIIFQVGKFTDGDKKTVEDFEYQYDFFYGSGASVLIDGNYKENFSYFQPLWIKNELPEFFVVFKVPGPLDYSYAANQTYIEDLVTYKVIQNTESTESFTVSYGKDSFGEPVIFGNDNVFIGNSLYSSYDIKSGSGMVVELNELKNLDNVKNISDVFNSKILPNSSVVSTFDLREGSKIGNYIRSIINNNNFKKAPIDFSLQQNTYTYFNGVDVKNGVFGKQGEILYDYLIDSSSSIQSDFEDYITSGFERNGIISSNILNLEFLFNDNDSDLYSINRYYGFYVSRNDLGEFKLNGNYFYKFKDMDGNLNEPKPSRDSIGYYYNNINSQQSSTGGVRLFYEGASGWIPGSYDVNVNDPQKLYYITDKHDNLYSLKRVDGFDTSTSTWSDLTSGDSKYGPYSEVGFGITGNSGLSTGSVVISNKSINLLNFSGIDNDTTTPYYGILPNSNGNSNITIEFNKLFTSDYEIVFKVYWPNGTYKENAGRYDLIISGEFGGSLPGWNKGSSYNIGTEHFFNGIQGDTSDIAASFSECVLSIDDNLLDCIQNANSSIIKVKSSGYRANSEFRISIFDDYDIFTLAYKDLWNESSAYSIGDIVYYNGKYYEALSIITVPTATVLNLSPDIDNTDWSEYNTFSNSGYVKLAGSDASSITGAIPFSGGTDYSKCRVAFDIKNIDKIKAGDWIEVEGGTGITGGVSMIESISRYVDSPISNNGSIIGFNGFNEFLVANLSEQRAVINLGSDSMFRSGNMTKLYSGVFSFFDVKDFDFDFLSSLYGITPSAEYHRYFELLPAIAGQIKEYVKYFVRKGTIRVDIGLVSERDITEGNAFIGSSVNYFSDISSSAGVKPVVLPAIFTKIGWVDETYAYADPIRSEENLDSFEGFYGIQSIADDQNIPQTYNKSGIFEYGKINNEYLYLEEPYTQERANRSKIVPYINKWGYLGGSDSRGNPYRLNVSAAFSPTNFSPSFQKELPDPRYLTHEWMLLEGVPRDFPVDMIAEQKGYLPSKVDLDKIQSADPNDSLYFSSFFTASPEDYQSPYNISTNLTKELFTPLVFNPISGFYETVFRGVRVVLKRRSNVLSPSNIDKYVSNYRGFEDYKFAAVLRVIPEDSSIIQSPVSYEFIENMEQKSVLFICKIVIKDYRAFELGYTGGTGGDPQIDYTLLYSLRDKKISSNIGATGSGESLYAIDDIKLSSALDLSIASGSSVTTTTNPGFIYINPNIEYDTDLREEINLFYPVGGTGSISLTGNGSFIVPRISNATYPWPIGRSKNFASFGPIGANYTFSITFSLPPTTIPLGTQSTYANIPVFQLGGGEGYFNFIIRRISLAEISSRVNTENAYIKYTTYYWDSDTSSTKSRSDNFQIYMEQPTAIRRETGLKPIQDYSGPQTLGQNQPTGYRIQNGGSSYGADILRYNGGYEPIFKKIIKFKNDKNDSIIGYPLADLKYRNCTFAPEKKGFGYIKNLNFSKVSISNNILQASDKLPLGPVYPLVNESPITQKDLSIFSSTWDPGFYDMYESSTDRISVAGTRTMKEQKSFFMSKMMQTPYSISTYTFISLEVSRNSGSNDVSAINSSAKSAIGEIQNITGSTSNSGIGQLGTIYSTTDLQTFDEDIFPDVEVFWQKNDRTNKLTGTIRLDRILRRYLLNSGINKVFVDNMVSEFGVGDPDSINDDIKTYIDRNVSPIYKGISFELFVKKTGTALAQNELLLRGDLINPDRIKYAYYAEKNYKLTKRSSLEYTFEFSMEVGKFYSTTFNFRMEKI